MLKVFRKARQHLLTENKFRRYFIYAIGEIILVVIGILIALQINNWNEKRKNNLLLHEYEHSLIRELRIDLEKLNSLENSIRKKKEGIKNYFDYYNSETPGTETLFQKAYSLNLSKEAFYTTAYTIEDLITTGNLSLFPETKRSAILKLKNVHEINRDMESSATEWVALYEVELPRNFDLALLSGLTSEELEASGNPETNSKSEQLRVLHNVIIQTFRLYEAQSIYYHNIISATRELLKGLSGNNTDK